MIVTHAQAMNGARRVYLGGKASLECWIEPRADGPGWTFHLDNAVTGNALSEDDRRAWAIHTLTELARELNVAPAELAAVHFEQIAALHASNPFDGRRVPVPKRKSIENGFMTTAPGITRPSANYAPGSGGAHRHRA